jgi:hypothetical protein
LGFPEGAPPPIMEADEVCKRIMRSVVPDFAYRNELKTVCLRGDSSAIAGVRNDGGQKQGRAEQSRCHGNIMDASLELKTKKRRTTSTAPERGSPDPQKESRA